MASMLGNHRRVIRAVIVVVAVVIGIVSIRLSPAIGGDLTAILTAVLGGLVLIFVLGNTLSAPRYTGLDFPDVDTAGDEAKIVPPDVEDSLDETRALASVPTETINAQRSALIDELRTTTFELLTHRGLPEDNAREAVRMGTWTDDEQAGSLLAEGVDYEVDWEERFEELLTGTNPFHQRLEHTVAELQHIEASSGATFQVIESAGRDTNTAPEVSA